MTELATAFEAGPLRAAARVALDGVGVSPVTVEPIDRGNSKQTAIARFRERGPVVVQVCAEQRWLRTEAALLRELRQRTFVPVPPVLSAGTHGGVAYMLTAYVAGEDLHGRFTGLGQKQRRELAHWFGRALARVHEAFRFDGYGRLDRSGDGFVAEHDNWGAWFRGYGQRAVGRLPAEFDPLRGELLELFERVPETRPAARLFPWDFRPGNALVADGSVTAVLDWERPLAAVPALSVAKSEYLVADWYVADPEPLRRGFRAGYATVREYPSVRPTHRVAAIAESAVDSTGTVTNPSYPPVGRSDAVTFHRTALRDALAAAP